MKTDDQEQDRFSYYIRSVNDIVVIDFIGDLDMYTIPLAHELLDTLIANKKFQIVFNLAQLKYIDSSGLGFFSGAHKNLTRHKGNIKLANLSSYVQRIFSVIHLDYFIDIYDSVQEALADFEQAVDKAIKNYTRIIEENPTYADAHFHLGCALINKERYEEAVEELKTAISINDKYVDAYNKLGSVYKIRNMHEEAVRWFKKALEIQSDSREALANLGMLYGDMNLMEEAIENYRKAISVHPEYADYHFELGKLLKAKKELEAAVGEFEEAIKLNPLYIAPRLELADSYALGGRKDKARNELKKVLDMALDEETKLKVQKMMDRI